MVIKLAKINVPCDDIVLEIDDDNKQIRFSADNGETDVTFNK